MKNANTNPSHSFTEGADYEPGLMQPKTITAEYLLKNDFQQVDDTLYHLRIENGNMSALLLSVDIISPIGYMVELRDERNNRGSVLPIENQYQISKLINALKGI